MIDFLKLFVHVVVWPFKTRAQLEAEIVLLRHQLNVLRRRVPSKPKLAVVDRLLFVWLYRLFPSVLSAVAIVQPETIIRWHRAGFRLYWRWKSRSRGGRPKVSHANRHREKAAVPGRVRVASRTVKRMIVLCYDASLKRVSPGYKRAKPLGTLCAKEDCPGPFSLTRIVIVQGVNQRPHD